MVDYDMGSRRSDCQLCLLPDFYDVLQERVRREAGDGDRRWVSLLRTLWSLASEHGFCLLSFLRKWGFSSALSELETMGPEEGRDAMPAQKRLGTVFILVPVDVLSNSFFTYAAMGGCSF